MKSTPRELFAGRFDCWGVDSDGFDVPYLGFNSLADIIQAANKDGVTLDLASQHEYEQDAALCPF